MRTRISLCCLVVIFTVSTVTAKEFVHPKLKSRETTYQTIVVLPPVVTVSESGMKGSESMLSESDMVGRRLRQLVAQALESQGFEVVPSPFGEDGLSNRENPAGNTEELKYSLANIQNRYDTLTAQLYKKPKDVNKGRFSLGKDFASVYPDTLPDAMVFVRAGGNVLTGGKKAFGWLVAGPTRNNMVTYVSVVDSQSGEILFFSIIGAAGDFVNQTEKVFGKRIAKALQKFPR